jgi:hypothetical protein
MMDIKQRGTVYSSRIYSQNVDKPQNSLKVPPIFKVILSMSSIIVSASNNGIEEYQYKKEHYNTQYCTNIITCKPNTQRFPTK